VALVLVFLFAPLVVVVLFSFHSTPSLTFPFRGLSLRWYRDVFASSSVQDAIVNSLRVAIVSAILVLAVGTAAALAMTRYRFRGQSPLRILLIAPAALPPLFLGIALLSFFVQNSIRLSLWTVTLGHILYTLPYFYLVANARLTRFDPALEESAHDLGAGSWATFRRVTLPLIAPTLIAGAMLVVALSWDEFLITLFTVGNENTLPLVVWSRVRHGIDPSINANSALLLAGSLSFIFFVRRLIVEPR
jgi:spermidine/putrescine transport system permease protein